MEPVNPLLPALRADTPGLLRRAADLIGAVRGIQQEASADYWISLLHVGVTHIDQRRELVRKCTDLLKHDIELALQRLEKKATLDKTSADNEEDTDFWEFCVYDDDGGGSVRWEFDYNKFCIVEKSELDGLFVNYNRLATLQSSPSERAQIMLDGADCVKKFIPYSIWVSYINSAFVFDKKINTLRRKLKNNSFWQGEDCEVWSEIIAAFPNEPDAYLARAEIQEKARSYPAALSDLNVCILLLQTNSAAFKLRSRVRNFLGDVPGMVEDAIAAERLGAVLKKGWLDPPFEPPF